MTKTRTESSIETQIEKLPKKTYRSRSIIQEFGLNTSTHGIPGIARSTSHHNRIFWSISLLIFVGIMLYFIIKSIIAYFQYPTQTSIDIIVEYPQAFPSVTVCNYSPYVYYRFIGPFLNYTNSNNLTNTTDTTKFTRQLASYVPNFLLYNLRQENSIQNLAYPLETMLMTCNYNDLPCTVADFISFTSLGYGMCYTFNAQTENSTNSSIRYSSDNGGSGRLALTFYIHRHQYVPYVTQNVGMMAMIHDNDQFPIIAPAGFQLAPGKNYKMSYKKRTNIFLPSPYTSCETKVSLAMQVLFERYQSINYAYSQTLCYTICMQTFVYEKCGCVSPKNWAARSIVFPGTDKIINAPLCNWTNNCPTGVTVEFSQSASFRDTKCPNCGPECSANNFLVKLSSLTTPVESQFDSIKSFVESTSVPLAANWSEDWRNELPKNYISLEVVCESTQTEVLTQQAAIGAVDVISNVGGQTGLWIGISFLSLFEIIEMLYRLMRSQCHFLREKIKKRSKQEHTDMGP
ncbi:unnamed protein product [Adineta ricciae]|uniref:Uncharacterized protein n=1 Tax=Adineta ricciae TaxID=249248 RepID=A0A814LB88_ADIRI|nr:unnamed protein product [Adineta ricciae]CAF1274979.1 unnamed protein product [Adineta ricciae]